MCWWRIEHARGESEQLTNGSQRPCGTMPITDPVPESFQKLLGTGNQDRGQKTSSDRKVACSIFVIGQLYESHSHRAIAALTPGDDCGQCKDRHDILNHGSANECSEMHVRCREPNNVVRSPKRNFVGSTQRNQHWREATLVGCEPVRPIKTRLARI